METFEKWLNEHFVPVARKISERTWVTIIGSAMQSILPFILTGSVVFLYNVIRSYLPSLPDLSFISNYSFGMIGILTAFYVTRNAMDHFSFHDYSTIAPLVSITTFLAYTNPISADSITKMDFSKLGPVGILPGMIIGVITAQVFRVYAKIPLRDKLKESELPDFVSGWINAIIPIACSITIAYLVTFVFDWDLFAIVNLLFSPIQQIGQSLPGLILLALIPSIMMSMGISSWSFNAISTPVYMLGIQQNIDAVAKGADPTNIVTNETVFTASLITMGGIGYTLILNILLLRSKSQQLKSLGRITLLPSLFGINEPVLFATPVVMNPILMVPMWICTIIGSIVVWLVMSTGLLNIPSSLIFTGQLPVLFSTVIATKDLRGILWFAVLFVLYFLIYRPFFKVYEKQVLANEEKQ